MPDEAPKNAPTSTPHADRTIVPQVPDHEMIRRIGGGSYGEVWLARSVMGTYRAVKIVYRESFDNERPFLREFNGIQKFEPISRSHESQVDILQVGKGEGYFYYVMELADDATTECSDATTQRQRSGGVMESWSDGRTQTTPQSEPASPDSAAPPLHHSITPSLRDAASYVPKTLGRELYQRGKLPFDECLRISLSLTTALEHLHKHGLVHRDIKPSNIIFVNGIPKLADIGLVTSIDATVSYVGTEGFLPPEGPGTPQGDIYSLGKVLYEICTGRDRQDFPELPTNLAELPEREGLLELNAIISKACKNAPGDRYQSATEMHADIVLLQSGKSVRRVRSLERRLAHATRIGMAVTALGGVMTLGFVFQRHETHQARRLAEENRRLAAKSQQVAQFLKDMLKGVNPSVALGRDTMMVREILDKTAERLGKDLAGQPAVEAELRSTIGEIYHEIGRYSESEAMQRRALALRRLVLGNEHPDVAVSLKDLGVALYDQGRKAESEIAHREALRLRIKIFGNEHPDVAESLDCVGFVLCNRGKLVEAETLIRKALAMRQKLLGKDNVEVASSLNNLAIVLRNEGKLSEAEAMFREVLALARRLRGDDDLRLQSVICNLARVLAEEGKLAEAEPLLRQAVEYQRKLFGDEHGYRISALCELAHLLEYQGKDTESTYRDIIQSSSKLLNQGFAPTQNEVAWLLATSADPKVRDGPKAVGFAQKAVAATERKDPEYLDTLAAAYAESGQFDRAVSTQKEALALLRTETDKKDFASRMELYLANSPFRQTLDKSAPFRW